MNEIAHTHRQQTNFSNKEHLLRYDHAAKNCATHKPHKPIGRNCDRNWSGAVLNIPRPTPAQFPLDLQF